MFNIFADKSIISVLGSSLIYHTNLEICNTFVLNVADGIGIP